MPQPFLAHLFFVHQLRRLCRETPISTGRKRSDGEKRRWSQQQRRRWTEFSLQFPTPRPGGDGSSGRRRLPRLFAHQTLSDLSHPHRKRGRLRSNDVQTMQARLLLVLLGIPGQRLFIAPLRSRALQKQVGSFPGFRHLAPDAGRRYFCRIRNALAHGLSILTPRRALHSML